MLERIELWNEWRNQNIVVVIDLRGADLSWADLRWADLRWADLRGADLSWADLSGADLSNADLRGADLSGADLSNAVMRGADLRWADLNEVDLHGANLSRTSGFPSSSEWLTRNLEKDSEGRGVIAYKAIGNTPFIALVPESWVIAENAVIEEVPNPDRSTLCGSGINVGTRDWVTENYSATGSTIWRVLIEWMDLADVIMPFGTDGKFRARRVTLLNRIE